MLKVSGTLSGLPSKVRVHHMEVPGQGDDNNIVPFSMVPTDDNVLEGHFYAFPHCPTDPETWSKHKLCCYVINEQEERRFFEWDVTSQVDEQDGETYVKIVVRDMDVCGMNDLGRWWIRGYRLRRSSYRCNDVLRVCLNLTTEYKQPII